MGLSKKEIAEYLADVKRREEETDWLTYLAELTRLSPEESAYFLDKTHAEIVDEYVHPKDDL